MGDDVVHLPPRLVEVLPRFQILFWAGQLLPPPGSVVDPEWCSSGFQRVEFQEKQGIVRFQDATLDIVAAGPSHGENPFPIKVKHLPTLQQEYRGADAANFSAVPILQRIGPQGVIVFVVPCHEQGGKGPALQEVQSLIIPAVSIPHATHVSAN